MDRPDRVRRAQIAFLILLAVAFAQVVWWVFDQTTFQRDVQSQRLAGLERERRTAVRLVTSGDAELEALGRSLVAENPDLELVDGGVELSPSTTVSLDQERRSRLNRYLWEGGFFLVVLAAGMSVIGRALRQEAALRRRQENFLAAVSHELKSPLASLRLAVEAMSRRELERTQQERWLGRSLGDVDRLESLVGKLLDSSRLESDRIELIAEPIALRQIVTDTIDELQQVGGGGRVSNEVSADVELFGDRMALTTIVRNLIDNAIKATEEKGGVVVSASADDSGVTLTVSDTGTGFDPSEAERLFEKFYRPGDELRRGRTGTGLGLYLVAGLARLAGGTVSAHSAGVDQGSRFDVRWPRRV